MVSCEKKVCTHFSLANIVSMSVPEEESPQLLKGKGPGHERGK